MVPLLRYLQINSVLYMQDAGVLLLLVLKLLYVNCISMFTEIGNKRLCLSYILLC